MCRKGHITIVGERGGFVDIGTDPVVGTQVMLQFGFPLVDEVVCVGVVRRHEPAVGVEVEFVGLSDADHKRIGVLVSSGGKGDEDLQAQVA